MNLPGRKPVELTGCLSTDAHAVVTDLIRTELEKGASAALNDDDGPRMASRASIRASVAQARVSLDDIRTARDDPQSTKTFCEGRLSLTFPSEVIADAEAALEAMGRRSLNDQSDDQGIDRAANKFTADLDFAVQPTDDGTKIYAELQDAGSILAFYRDVIVAHLASGPLREVQANNARELAEQQRLELEASTAEQEAMLAQAQSEHALAEQAINATWRAIPDATRETLLPAQRAWIKRKTADCTIEAASTSTEPGAREAGRLGCETRITSERTEALARYVHLESESADLDASYSR